MFFLGLIHTVHADNGSGKLVYVIPIEETVEKGLESFIERATETAISEGADHLLFEVDTPGGRVDAATQIAEIIQSVEVETSAFVVNEALSAGSYLALNTDHIFMTANATMGASGVINSDGTAAAKKAQSAWIAAMKAAAESKGRNPLYAEAMADPSVDLPELNAPSGEFLTLSAKDAVEVGYSASIVEDRTELLAKLNLSEANVVEIKPTLLEKVARFLTNPIVVPILLSIASIGLIVEFFSPGFGIPGFAGLGSLALFFYGHIVAGLAGYEAIVFVIIGIVLMVAELFVPGGILGVLGIASIVGALFMSSADIGHMAMSIAIAILISIVVFAVLFKRIGLEKGFFRHIILRDATTSEKGYVSTVSRLDLIGLQGVSLTPLRPSGTGLFDGERLDVVTEGGYVKEQSNIRVVKTEGARIIVREVESK
ncbi:nodulation protein NfeD [Radiobacillus kanasensis]|uniref:NfeD family protein n=1 Tax=Radiobacillus kanasensis TaxID=2844358 RepID=UPI001E527D70|nr:nodulation protein NfeD [Radiobacillus kanasensis]UFU01388.1 nodulation protein NfeD [Radiobacillus kanasensis]